MRGLSCFVSFCIFVYVETKKQERAVNVALETVLEFDNKSNDLKLIADVQTFLNKVKNVLGGGKISRRHSKKFEMKFTDFLQNLVKVLISYEDDDLEDVFDVVESEIRKFHYEGCKVPELLENSQMRRFMADKLEEIKETPAHKIRKCLNKVLRMLQENKFDKNDLDFINFINSLYDVDETQKLINVINNLEVYKSGSKRTEMDLKNIIKHGIRTVFFDHYSSLKSNLRRQIKVRIESYWHNVNNPDMKKDHRIYNILWKHTPTTTEKVKVYNIVITPAPQNLIESENNDPFKGMSEKHSYLKSHQINPGSLHKLKRIKPVFETYYKDFITKGKYLNLRENKHHKQSKEKAKHSKSKKRKRHQKHKLKTVHLEELRKPTNTQNVFEAAFSKKKKKHSLVGDLFTSQKMRTIFEEEWTKLPKKHLKKHGQSVLAEEYAMPPKKQYALKKENTKHPKKRSTKEKQGRQQRKQITFEPYEKNYISKKEKSKKNAFKDPIRIREPTKKLKLQTIWEEQQVTHRAKMSHKAINKIKNKANADVEKIRPAKKNKRYKDETGASANISDKYTEAESKEDNSEKVPKSNKEATRKRQRTTRSRKFIPIDKSNEGLTIESFESFVHRKNNVNDSFLMSNTSTTIMEKETTTEDPHTEPFGEIEKDLADIRSQLIVRNITEDVQHSTTEVASLRSSNVTIDKEAEAIASLVARKFEELDFWEGTTGIATEIKNPKAFRYVIIRTTRTIPASSPTTETTTTPFTSSTTATTTTTVTTPTTTSTTVTTTNNTVTTELTAATKSNTYDNAIFRAGIKYIAFDNRQPNSSNSNRTDTDVGKITKPFNKKPRFPVRNNTNKVLLFKKDVVKSSDLKISTKNTTQDLVNVNTTSTTVKLNSDIFINTSSTVNLDDLAKDITIPDSSRRSTDLSNIRDMLSDDIKKRK